MTTDDRTIAERHAANEHRLTAASREVLRRDLTAAGVDPDYADLVSRQHAAHVPYGADHAIDREALATVVENIVAGTPEKFRGTPPSQHRADDILSPNYDPAAAGRAMAEKTKAGNPMAFR